MTVGAITVTAQATSSPDRHDKQGSGDFYLAISGDLHLATSGDLHLATNGDFYMATDIEMKTINNDTDHQVRAALGQLAYYDHFKVSPRWPSHDVIRCAIFDLDIGQELSTFLEEEGVGAIALTTAGTSGLNPQGQAVLAKLPLTQAV